MNDLILKQISLKQMDLLSQKAKVAECYRAAKPLIVSKFVLTCSNICVCAVLLCIYKYTHMHVYIPCIYLRKIYLYIKYVSLYNINYI